MTYVNNYRAEIELAQGNTAAALDLPDGTYRLTLSDTRGTRWEIIDAAVTGGSAAISRAQEGTADQDWPHGSVIYCDVTAAQMNELVAQLVDITSRVVALENAAGGTPDGALTDPSGNALTDQTGNILTAGA